MQFKIGIDIDTGGLEPRMSDKRDDYNFRICIFQSFRCKSPSVPSYGFFSINTL